MENQSDVRRVSIRNLLLAILRSWKVLLAVALVLAFLVGGAKGVLAWRSAGDAEKRAREAAEYQAALELYEGRVEDLTAQIERQESAILSQQEYLDQSVLMNVDPYHTFEGVLYLYISTDYQIMPDTAYQNPDQTMPAVLLYKAALNGSRVLDPVAKAVGMELIYLRELVNADVVMVGTSANPILSVTVRAGTREQVERILESVDAQLEGVRTEITGSIGDHTVDVAVQSVREYVDQTLSDQQKTALDRVDKLTATLDETKAELSELKAPSAPSYTKRSILKTTLKYGIVFGVLGFLGVAFGVCVKFIAGDRLYSGSEIVYRCDLKLLGSVSLKARKRCGIDRKIRELEGRGSPEDTRIYSLIAALIQNGAQGAVSVLLAGQADEAVIGAVAQRLSAEMPEVRVCTGGSLVQDAAAARKLRECDAVVLVEQCGVSRYSRISAQAESVREMGKPLLGCVAVDD